MPVANSQGIFCFGVGNGTVSLLGGPYLTPVIVETQAGGVTQLNDNQFLYQANTPTSHLRAVTWTTNAAADVLHGGNGGNFVQGRANVWAATLVTGAIPTTFSSGFVVMGRAVCSVGQDGTILLKAYPATPTQLEVRNAAGTLLRTVPVIANFSGEAFHVDQTTIFQRQSGTNDLYLEGVKLPLVVNVGTYQWFYAGTELWLTAQGQSGYNFAFPVSDPSQGFQFGELEAFNPAGAFVNGVYYLGTSNNSASELPQFAKLYAFTAADMRPLGTAPSQKLFGYYFTSSKYGDYFPRQNVALCSTEDFYDSNGVDLLPPGTPGTAASRMRTAALAAGGVICNPTQANIDAIKDRWDLVKGLFLSEFSTSAEMSAAAQTARQLVAANGLPARPILATIKPLQLFSPGWVNPAVDILAVEIYFDGPGPGSYAAQYAAAADRIAQVLVVAGAIPVLLIAQTYDRNGTYMDIASAVAITDACKDALLAHP